MYKSIQACRGIAALLVVLHHLGGTLALGKYFGAEADVYRRLFTFGDVGVEFFFVLSGFIITLVHRPDFGRMDRLGSYVRKRVTRIYPSYVLIFAITYVAALMVVSDRPAVPHDPVVVLKALLLLPLDPPPVLSVAWTLQYEMVFYLFIAVLIASRASAAVAGVALIANYFFCFVSESCGFLPTFLSSGWIFLFVAGAATAYLATGRVRMTRPFVVGMFSASTFLAVGMVEAAYGTGWIPIDRRVLYGSLSAFIIMSLVQAEDQGFLPGSHPALSFMGDMSYLLYLIHFPLISALCMLARAMGLHGAWGAAASFVLILAICVGVAAALHIHVEKPLLRFITDIGRRHHPAHVD